MAVEINEPSGISAKGMLWRGMALLVLIMVVLFWCQRHLGLLVSDWGKLPVFVMAAAAWGLIGKLATDETLKGGLSEVRQFSEKVVFATPVLIGLYLLAGLVFATISSAIVLVEDTEHPLQVTIGPLDDPSNVAKETTKHGSARVVIWTGPFGRAFRLSVDTYKPEVMTIYPIVGLTVDAGQQLRRAPTLLLRLPAEALAIVQSEGTIVVSIDEQKDNSQESVRITSYEGKIERLQSAMSLTFGPSKAVPSVLNDIWRLQAAGLGATPKQVADLLIGWQNLSSANWYFRLPLASGIVRGNVAANRTD